jgi:adenylate kinase family enzyme
MGGEPLPSRGARSILVCMKHIAILGQAGAGKSWLARELAEALGLPVIHLDRLYWKPAWVPTPEPEWKAIQRREVAREAWIADGLQEGRSMPELWLDSADTIVFIDASPLSCVWRVIGRRRRGDTGPEGPADCEPAPFYRAFPKFLRFLWLYDRRVRPEVLAELDRRRADQQVAVLRNEGDVRTFLETVKAQQVALGESLLT